jgi:hypothetical protein
MWSRRWKLTWLSAGSWFRVLAAAWSVNPAVIEARQGRTALSRLLAGIDLPDSESFVALRASRAARARWNGQEAP